MDVCQAIRERRAFRSLKPAEITEDLIKDLAEHAQLAPSCSNNQPWRFVFVYDSTSLQEMSDHDAHSHRVQARDCARV